MLAPGYASLTYHELWCQVQRTMAALTRLGIVPEDRVAVVLPNGPEMACAFLAIAAGATCAPLNPSYHAQEYAFYLEEPGGEGGDSARR